MTPRIVHIRPWGVPITAHVDYEQGEARTWEHPGSAAQCVLHKAFIGGVDVTDMVECEPDQVARIEADAAEAIEGVDRDVEAEVVARAYGYMEEY